MLTQLKSIGKPTTLKAIHLFEEKIGCKFPDDYKNFLLENNGGRPKPDGVPVSKHLEKVLPIMVFHGIEVNIESDCIEWDMDAMKDRIPDKLLPIAHSDNNDIYCLDLSDKNYGKIYFWDLRGECGKACWDNIYFVANSFTELLQILTD